MPTGRVEKKRVDWDIYFLMMAHTASLRGSCDRKQVGAFIVDDGHRMVSSGYNGGAAGMPDCDVVGHLLKEIDGRQSCVQTLHAESNAIDYAYRNIEGCTLYTTVIPCFDCAKRIAGVGIIRVVYAEFYTSRNTGLVAKYFETANIEMVHIPIRFNFQVLCAEDGCSNLGRYESHRCGIHDLGFTDEV